MSASRFIHYFFSHHVAFRMQAATVPDNIVLNAADEESDQSLSAFQKDINAAAHLL